jgi:hypothetical protein
MKNEMGGAYTKYGIQESCIQNIDRGKPEEKRPLGKTRLYVDGRIILKWIFKK